MDHLKATSLLFQRNGTLYECKAQIQACIPASDLAEVDQQLFKGSIEDVYAVIVDETIFHPQGGGQPSDVGKITVGDSTFEVVMTRTSVTTFGVVLHFGRFATASSKEAFSTDRTCTLHINVDKRILFSKYHTAGHVLGSAVRTLLEKEVEGFDELKASHFPDSASCEFLGFIAGTHKDSIQRKLDEYIAAAMPVEIDFWSEEDFKKEGLDRLIPDEQVREAMGVKPGGKFRVVKILGAEVYPCGGTHVATSKECGKTVVKKISRSKGQSRVSYNLPEA